MEEEIAAGTENKRYFTTVLRAYRERGQDIIARHAPCLIFALARRLNITGVSNAEQSWAYAELFAPIILSLIHILFPQKIFLSFGNASIRWKSPIAVTFPVQVWDWQLPKRLSVYTAPVPK